MRTVAFVVLLFSAAPAARSEQATISSTVLPERAVSYHGAVVISDEVFVALAAADCAPKWCRLGDNYQGLKFVEISSDFSEIICLNNRNERLSLSLSRAELVELRPASATAPLIGLEQLDWKWIRSEANPMKNEAPDLPFEKAITWKDWPEQDRIILRNYYRKHGWDLVVEVSESRIKVERRPLYDPREPRVRDKTKNLEAIPSKL